MTQWIVAHWQDILAVLGGLYVVATTVAALTPSDADNKALAKIAEVANKFGITLKPAALPTPPKV